MPLNRQKPSEIAQEAKRKFIPALEDSHDWSRYMLGSYCIRDTDACPVDDRARVYGRPRVVIEDNDPVNLTIHSKAYGATALVNSVNEKKAGGDWELGSTATEECLARRSTLVHALRHNYQEGGRPDKSFYPIPQRGSIYSPNVVIFRDGERGGHGVYEQYQEIPVISVAPIRGPRLDVTGSDYSFPEERELMESKMRSILRTAAWARIPSLCIAAFGLGPTFKNPARITALMWKQLLFHDQEFAGAFKDIIFAIDTSSSSASKTTQSDLDAYREVFHPSSVIQTTYRESQFTYD